MNETALLEAARPMPRLEGYPVSRIVPRLRGDPLALYREVFESYGDIVRIPILGDLISVVLVASPEGVEHVLSGNHAGYRKPAFLVNAFRPVAGDGLFSSRGAKWKRNRRLIAPAFHKNRLRDGVPGIVAAATAHAAAWARRDTRDPYDILHDLNHLTLDVASSVFFGATLGSGRGAFAEALREGMVQVNHRLNSLFDFPLWIPTARNRATRRARDVLRGAVETLLDEKQGLGGESPDLLTRLFNARHEGGDRGLTRRELIDEMLVLLIAGHDTSAAGLAWTLHLLAENPCVLADVQDEIDEVLGGRAPTAEDVPRLRLTRMAFEEALRLYPPAWGQAREAIADDVLCGYPIRKGTLVMPSQWVIHRHPRIWKEPDRFDPLRFTPERVAARPRFAYFPFGGGPRLCIGRTLALLEAPLILAVLLSRFRFHSTESPVELDPTIALRPRRLVMRVVPR
jgi:cytochrome P450